MQKIFPLVLSCLSLVISGSSIAAPKIEKRCGWLENPTPANFYLIDATGEYWIFAQGSGGVPVDDLNNLPHPDEKEYVETNVHYGYSCACLNVSLDAKKTRIVRLYSGQSLPLKTCLDDKKLPQKLTHQSTE